MLIEFTPELVAIVAGAILSWLFGWFPGLRTWYAAIKTEIKSVIMLLLLAVISVSIYFLVQFGILVTPEPIPWWRILTVFYFASTMNQTVYKLTPQAADVKNKKELRMSEG